MAAGVILFGKRSVSRAEQGERCLVGARKLIGDLHHFFRRLGLTQGGARGGFKLVPLVLQIVIITESAHHDEQAARIG